MADLLRADEVDPRRRGKDQRAREESGALKTDLVTDPRLGGIGSRDEAFSRDETAHYHAPNESRLLDASEIKDIGGDGLTASIKDENGNIIGLIQ